MEAQRVGSSRASRLFGVAVLAALAVVLVGCESETTVVNSPDPGGIAVTGTGTVTVTPDIAQLHLGVEARGATVAEVRQAAAVAQEAVRASLKRNGIADRDIQTQGLSIHPEYGSRPIPTPTPASPRAAGGGGVSPSNEPGFSGEPVIAGYVMTNTVSVKVRNLDAVSKVIDEAVAAGGDVVRLNGIAFGVDEPERHAAEARELAVRDARQRAEALAKLAGVDLGRPRSVNEFLGGGGPISARAALGAAEAAVPTPIDPGETEITMQVSIVYEIRS